MDHRRISEPDPVAQARALLAAAAEGVRRLEGAAQQAFCRLAALAGLTGSPVFLSDTLQRSAAAFENGQLLALQQGSNQLFLIDVFNLLNPSVDQALLGNPLIEQMLLASLSQ